MLLLADLLARAAELGGLQVLTSAVFPGDPPAQQAYAERSAELLGIHPPTARASSAAAAAVLGGPADVHIAGPGGADDHLRGVVTVVGPVREPMAGSGADDHVPADATRAAGDLLAVRLVLMSHPHDQAADLDDSVLAKACDVAARWRGQVAVWAESASRPMPPPVRAALDAAFADVDTPTALQLLTDLAQDTGVPDGARFETFAFADRVLGLELTREVGRSRG